MSRQIGWLVMVPSSCCRRRLGGGYSTGVQRRKVCRVVANFNWTIAVSWMVWSFWPDCKGLGWICDVWPH